jgi:undecaprenyl-diphosphatase
VNAGRPEDTGDRDRADRPTAPRSGAEQTAEIAAEMASPVAPEHDSAPPGPVDLPEVAPDAPLRVGTLLAIGVGSGIAFAALTSWVIRSGLTVPLVDQSWHDWVLDHRSAGDIAVANALTWGGATVTTLPALFVVGMLAPPGRRPIRDRLGAGALLAGLASLGVYAGLAVNGWVDRLRAPVADWAGAASGPSYPSGHTTAATLFALSCAWALSSRARPGRSRRALWLGAACYAVVVGATRVWLGVHWPSDVLGGWLFGTAWFTVTTAAVITAERAVSRRRGRRTAGQGIRTTP